MKQIETNLLDEFNNLKPELNKLSDDIIIHSKIYLAEMNYQTQIGPTSRIKDNESLRQKAFYRRKRYTEPLREIEDKVGVRIVLLRSTQVQPLADRFKEDSQYEVRQDLSIPRLLSEQPEHFGYQSAHLIVRPGQSHPLYKSANLPFLSCEVQIRTLLQHAYAEVSHDTVYKGDEIKDPAVLRALSRSVALMEVADDQFERVFAGAEQSCSPESEMYQRLRKYISNEIKSELSSPPNAIANFELLKLVKVYELDIDTVLEGLRSRTTDVRRAVENNSLYAEPGYMLAAYCIIYKNSSIAHNWPLNLHSLSSLAEDLGFGDIVVSR